ncbi:hypothetical protein M5D96_000321, partial [Drosophila gunungcola]
AATPGSSNNNNTTNKNNINNKNSRSKATTTNGRGKTREERLKKQEISLVTGKRGAMRSSDGAKQNVRINQRCWSLLVLC